MLLQPCLHHHRHKVPLCLSSTTFHTPPIQSKNPNFTPPQKSPGITTIACSSISQIHSYGGAVDYERRPMVSWNAIYKRISLMEKPESGAGSVLNQCDREGKKLTKWELCRVVKELRKYRRHHQALEVYEWMSNREERYRLSASDAAIHLDLIAKVHGISASERFFQKLPKTLKDRRIYGALLNAYVRARMIEQAESLIETMRNKGYVTHSLTFNVMMTLYMNLKQYDMVEMMISEMEERNIQLDIYSYNIWLSSRGSQGSAEKMEQIFEQMKLDRSINPNWTTFSTMATMYVRMGQIEKAEDCLRKVESRITGRDRIPYHYLLSLYGNCGNKEEVYRVWNTYKSVFPSIPNLGYHALMSSLVRIGDIKGVEQIYEEWLPVKSSYDPRIGNLLMGFYVKEGNVDKAKKFFEHMTEMGGKPNSNTWEILAEGHIRERRVPEALSCFKEAFAADGSKSWKPKPVLLSSLVNLCEEAADMESKEVLLSLCKQAGYLEDEAYGSFNVLCTSGNELPTGKDRTIDENNYVDNEASDGSEAFLNQL